MSDVEPSTREHLSPTLTAVERLKTKTVAIAQVQVAPSTFPALIALIIGVTASYLFWSQGESDAHVPFVFSIGLAILWRLRKPKLINVISRWSYLIIFSVFLIERGNAHPVYLEDHWVDVHLSLGLYLCGGGSYLVALAAWSHDREYD